MIKHFYNQGCFLCYYETKYNEDAININKTKLDFDIFLTEYPVYKVSSTEFETVATGRLDVLDVSITSFVAFGAFRHITCTDAPADVN